MTDPHLHPQTPEQTQPQKDTSVSQSQLWTIVLVTATVAIFVAVGITLLIVNLNTKTQQASETQLSPAEETVQQQEETKTNTKIEQSATASDNRILYTKQAAQSDILSYNTRTQEVQTWVEHPGDQTQFRHPQFLDSQSISYIKCTYGVVEDQLEEDQFCGIYKKSLTAEREILKVLPNVTESGQVEERFITIFGWNSTNDTVAYVADGYDLESNKSQQSLFVYDTDTNKSRRLDTYNTSLGRGGGVEDEVRVTFSPDDTKILVTLTNLYPVAQADDDQGTMFVYDTEKEERIWTEPNAWTTYGRWLNNNTFIASQRPSDSTNPQTSVIEVNPLTQTKTVLKEDVELHDIQVQNESTLIYWREDEREGNGIVMELMEKETQESTRLQEHAMPVSLSAQNTETLLYWTMSSCDSTANANEGMICGAALFNNDRPQLLQIYDIAQQEAVDLSPQFTYDDVRVADFW